VTCLLRNEGPAAIDNGPRRRGAVAEPLLDHAHSDLGLQLMAAKQPARLACDQRRNDPAPFRARSISTLDVTPVGRLEPATDAPHAEAG
jgi:hypothetical protein